jgi:hypothetical protein
MIRFGLSDLIKSERLMLGQRTPQRGFLDTDFLCSGRMPQNTFYALLASERDRLFADDDLAGMYRLEYGRPSVPPSMLALTLLLQCHDKVSAMKEGEKHDRLVAAAEILRELVWQDVEYDTKGAKLRQGVARDRVISAHDPEMRHGRSRVCASRETAFLVELLELCQSAKSSPPWLGRHRIEARGQV